jgi:hypothetical protein
MDANQGKKEATAEKMEVIQGKMKSQLCISRDEIKTCQGAI